MILVLKSLGNKAWHKPRFLAFRESSMVSSLRAPYLIKFDTALNSTQPRQTCSNTCANRVVGCQWRQDHRQLKCKFRPPSIGYFVGYVAHAMSVKRQKPTADPTPI